MVGSIVFCDRCKTPGPHARTGKAAIDAAKKAGWRTYKSHICPDCFAVVIAGKTKGERARMALAGTSGESIRQIAREFGVVQQTPINWARQ